MATIDQASRVTIEITARGYTTTLWAGDEKLAERAWTMTSRGGATAGKSDDWPEMIAAIDEDGAGEELADAIGGVEMDLFDIAGELWSMAEDWRGEDMPEVAE